MKRIVYIIALFASLSFACAEDERKKDGIILGTQVEILPKDSSYKELLLSPDLVSLCRDRPVSGFDFPVGPPNAHGYFKARGIIGGEHYGEDWNGNGGGNSDYGDLVYNIADGVVFYARDFRPGWGTVVRIMHNVGTKREPVYVESLYAHLASLWVRPGVFLTKGDPIGTMGTASNVYHSHLHFEIRKQVNMSIHWSEGADTTMFVSPTAYILEQRKNNFPN